MVRSTPAAAASSNTTPPRELHTDSRHEAFERLRRVTVQALSARHAGFVLKEGSEARAIQSYLPQGRIEAPLVSQDGSTLGILWAASGLSRRWTPADQRMLEDLAASAVTELELLAARAEIADRIRSAADDHEAAETKYLSIVEQLPLVTYIGAIDELSTTIYTSPQVEQIFGYTPEEWLADPEFFVNGLHPDDKARVLEEMARAHETGEAFSSEHRFYAKDGRLLRIQDEAVVVRDADGKPLYLHGFLLDVTERHEAAEALEETRTRFTAAFNGAPNGMALASIDGRFLLVNPALCQLVGYDHAELVGRSFHDITHGGDIAADLVAMKATLAGEIPGYTLEKRYHHRLGHEVPVRLTVSLIRDAQGEPSYFLGQMESLNDLHRLENQLRDSQKLEAVGRLAGGIAHDFNNLLTAISGYSERILERLDPEDRSFRDADLIRHSADRATTLTSQLLSFSRRQMLQTSVFSLTQAVRQLESSLPAHLSQGVEFSIELADEEELCVRADREQIEQALVQLAANACDAMQDGGRLTLKLSTRELPARQRAGEPDLPEARSAVVTVSDTGSGIDEATRSSLFEPFVSTKGRTEVAGLGLASLHGLVKQSGGDVIVTSALGSGTSFAVYLPLVDDLPAEPPAEVSESGPDASGTVLLAEDEDVVRMLVREMLEESGYAVLEASNAEAAIGVSKAHGGPIDLLLTDVVMPGMNGPTLAKELSESRPSMRVLYTSGFTDSAVAEHGVAVEETAFLAKPFSSAALTAKVLAVLDPA
jgi:two-component system, cell cycle sensor histidine kinase and response regulator CckA